MKTENRAGTVDPPVHNPESKYRLALRFIFSDGGAAREYGFNKKLAAKQYAMSVSDILVSAVLTRTSDNKIVWTHKKGDAK